MRKYLVYFTEISSCCAEIRAKSKKEVRRLVAEGEADLDPEVLDVVITNVEVV